ncbi:MAG TPA: DUF2877 domain-containing protein [Chloroflexota bacterium]|nr:DUF2877 domain-containing protein [Chloroflexota bacterium]
MIEPPARTLVEVARPVASLVHGPRRPARVLGVYARAAYLRVGDRIVALTTADAERLPFGLRLPFASRPDRPLLGLEPRSQVTVGGGQLTVETAAVALVARAGALWDPRPSAGSLVWCATILRARLDALSHLLAEQAPPESLAALVCGTPTDAPRAVAGTIDLSGTGRAAGDEPPPYLIAGLSVCENRCGEPATLDWRERARRHLALLMRALRQDDLGGVEAAARALVGLGPGLTPSADDVLGGMLAAGYFLGREFEPERRRWRAAGLLIRRAARGQTTPVSEALLACAATGAVGESAGTLLQALVAPDASRLAGALARTLALGHTSGADVALGILLGARLHLQARAATPPTTEEGAW